MYSMGMMIDPKKPKKTLMMMTIIYDVDALLIKNDKKYDYSGMFMLVKSIWYRIHIE